MAAAHAFHLEWNEMKERDLHGCRLQIVRISETHCFSQSSFHEVVARRWSIITFLHFILFAGRLKMCFVFKRKTSIVTNYNNWWSEKRTTQEKTNNNHRYFNQRNNKSVSDFANTNLIHLCKIIILIRYEYNQRWNYMREQCVKCACNANWNEMKIDLCISC